MNNPTGESLYQQIPAPAEATRERLKDQGRLKITHRPHCLGCEAALADSCRSSGEAQKAVKIRYCNCGQLVGGLVGYEVREAFWWAVVGAEAGEVG